MTEDIKRMINEKITIKVEMASERPDGLLGIRHYILGFLSALESTGQITHSELEEGIGVLHEQIYADPKLGARSA